MKPKDRPTLYYVILLCCAVLSVPLWLFPAIEQPEPRQMLIIGDSNEPVLVIEVVLWLQNEVGARPDGVVGPETTMLVNDRCAVEKAIYFNRLAARYMTPSGAPKEK